MPLIPVLPDGTQPPVEPPPFVPNCQRRGASGRHYGGQVFSRMVPRSRCHVPVVVPPPEPPPVTPMGLALANGTTILALANNVGHLLLASGSAPPPSSGQLDFVDGTPFEFVDGTPFESVE